VGRQAATTETQGSMVDQMRISVMIATSSQLAIFLDTNEELRRELFHTGIKNLSRLEVVVI
jgi:hypothetical protein